MHPRLAIFDFDGTLADSFSSFAKLIGLAAERYGFPRLDEEGLNDLRGLDARTIVKRLRIPRWKLPLIARFMRARAGEHPPPLFDGVAELLPHLVRQGLSVAIVSSNAEANVRNVLGPVLSETIARYECGVSLYGKASRLKKVVRRSGIPREQAIYVGDELRDAEASARAGIAFGAVSWGYTLPEALEASAPAALYTDVRHLGLELTGVGMP